MENDNIFPFHQSWFDVICDCEDGIIGEVFRASFLYWRDGIETQMKPIARVAFAAMRKGIDEDKERCIAEAAAREARAAQLRANGMKGGRPKGSKTKKNQLVSENNQMVSVGLQNPDKAPAKPLKQSKLPAENQLVMFGFDEGQSPSTPPSNNNIIITENNNSERDSEDKGMGKGAKVKASKPKDRATEEAACLERIEAFRKLCRPYCAGYPFGKADLPPRPDNIHKTYPDEMVAEFVAYWTEYKKDSTTSIRRDNEKYFDLARRLATWASHDKKYSTEYERRDNNNRPDTAQPESRPTKKVRNYQTWGGRSIGGGSVS